MYELEYLIERHYSVPFIQSKKDFYHNSMYARPGCYYCVIFKAFEPTEKCTSIKIKISPAVAIRFKAPKLSESG